VKERNSQPHTYSTREADKKTDENSAPGSWSTDYQTAELMKRDRKRLTILDSEQLPYLEKSVESRGEKV